MTTPTETCPEGCKCGKPHLCPATTQTGAERATGVSVNTPIGVAGQLGQLHDELLDMGEYVARDWVIEQLLNVNFGAGRSLIVPFSAESPPPQTAALLAIAGELRKAATYFAPNSPQLTEWADRIEVARGVKT